MDPHVSGRLGGLTTSARHDPSEYTQAAHRAFETRFLDIVDPDRILPVAERGRRAAAEKRRYFAKLSARGVAARNKKRGRSS